MPESISQLAAQIAAPSEDTLSASLRMGIVTQIEATGSFRVRTDSTGSAWLTRDRDTILTVGDKVWIIKQGAVWLVGGRLSGGQATPVGTVNAYAGATAPNGWLLCNGAAVSRVTYAALFAVIGTTYGSGDGSTTFNVPNLTNRVPVGSGGTYAAAATGGAATVTLSESQIPAHTHGSVGDHTHSIPRASGTQAVATGTGTTVANQTAGTTGGSGGHTHASVGGNAAHENMPPYLALPYIVRAL